MTEINFKHQLLIYRKVFFSSIISKCRLITKVVVSFLCMLLLQMSSLTYVRAQYYNQNLKFLNANSKSALGINSGLEFTSGTAVPWSTSTWGNMGTSTVSDPNTGDLLFYSNGGSVWNKDHQVMPNGRFLMGNSMNNRYSSYQGSLIVPFVSGMDEENQKVTKYYLFSLAERELDEELFSWPDPPKRGSLFFSVVDMALENGKGDVDVNYKNIVLDDVPSAGALIAIPGCNNDIWVITHSATDGALYKAYHITENGLDTIPILSRSIISNHPAGTLAVSPDRQKIVFTGRGGSNIVLSDFNPSTGVISNSIIIETALGDYTHAAFSPDNTKLYAIKSVFNLSTFSTYGYLFQYDISKFDETAISLSKDTIAGLSKDKSFSMLRLYNDTIYVADGNLVHRVNQPNNSGVTCDFQQSVITLSGSNGGSDLGNDVVFPMKSDLDSSFLLDTVICSNLVEEVVLTSFRTSQDFTYLWSTGDSTENIKIHESGVYWVKYGGACKHTDTFIITFNDLKTNIVEDGLLLSTTGGPFESYQWYLNREEIAGANSPTFVVTENGDYTVEVSDDYGCVFMSDIHKINNVNIKEIHEISQSIRVYPNPANERLHIHASVPVRFVLTSIDGKELLQGDSVSNIDIGSLAQGMYFITITDGEGRLLRTEKIIKRP